jgi:hypothetical protein
MPRTTKAPASASPPVGLATRGLVAVGVPAAAAVAAAGLSKFTTVPLPGPALAAVFVGAAVFGVALAVAMPWRGAPVLALVVALAIGVFVYLPHGGERAGGGIRQVGSAVQGMLGKAHR